MGFFPARRGVRIQVLFASKASNSLFMASYHSGFADASSYDEGSLCISKWCNRLDALSGKGMSLLKDALQQMEVIVLEQHGAVSSLC